jgi:predicted kinase
VIVVVAGPPCSGKSTIGEALAAKRQMVHLEMDAVRVRLMPDSPHTRHDRQIAYRAMHFMAEVLAERGQDLILDACYGHEEDRAEVARIAARLGVPLLAVECHVPLQAALERHRARCEAHPGLDLTEERVEEMVGGYVFSGDAVAVDGARPVEEGLERIEAALNAITPPASSRRSAT